MKFAKTAVSAALLGVAAAEVPQEHSHERFLRAVNVLLQIDNPLQIVDAVFGLLGDAAAADGAGLVTDLACLQQETADTAFTNAKAADDAEGMANALIFRTLERNTGAVGQLSELCTKVAINPEIAALTQHQDPASDNAAQVNKDITLALALQLAAIQVDPTLALLSGTFEPGQIGDPTGAGNTCDDPDDIVGCIFTENLIVLDASVAEINALVAGDDVAAADEADADEADADEADADEAGADEADADEADADEADAEDNAAANNNAGAGGVVNVQSFDGDLGGAAPAVNFDANADRPFDVLGSTFLNQGAAIQRSCAVQNNACSNAANSGQLDISVGDCNAQEDACLAAANLKLLRSRKITKVRQNNGLDFGDCSNPSIIFANDLDGRQQPAFAPANKADFSQGSALNIGIITNFICSQLESACKADEATIAACDQGATAAQGQQGQAAANAFNQALGL